MRNRPHPCIELLEARIAPAFAAVFPLSSLDGANGLKLSGSPPSERSGSSVSNAGDVNGDGFDDVLIGAPGAEPYGSGAAYVVFGKADGFVNNFNLSTLDGQNGFRLGGSPRYDAGYSIGAAGDVNGDGFDDVIIGAVNANGTGGAPGPGRATWFLEKPAGLRRI